MLKKRTVIACYVGVFMGVVLVMLGAFLEGFSVLLMCGGMLLLHRLTYRLQEWLAPKAAQCILSIWEKLEA